MSTAKEKPMGPLGTAATVIALFALLALLCNCAPPDEYAARDFVAEELAIPRTPSCGYKCQRWFEPGHMVADERNVWGRK